MTAKKIVRRFGLLLALLTALAAWSQAAMTEESAPGSMEEPDGMMETTDAARSGTLHGSEGHHASGTARLDATTLTLTLERVDRVPDGRVYLAIGGDRRQGVELGTLRQFSGVVRFALPEGLDAARYDSVIIWCEKFTVEIGRATLEKPMASGEEKGMTQHEPRHAVFAVH